MSVRNALLITIFLLFACPLLFCKATSVASPLQVSLGSSLMFKSGSIGEHLFNLTGKGRSVGYAPSGGREISFLQWDICGMMAVGLDVGVRYKAFHSQLSMDMGIPMESGKMDDYDWASTGGHQTHFSTHTNYLQDHYVVRGLVGWKFSFLGQRLELLPLLGFSWHQTSMIARNGYRQYVEERVQETTPWTDDIEKKPFSGDVISYRHEVFQVDGILRLIYNPSPRLALAVDASIHPVVAANGLDNHLLRSLEFLDYAMNGYPGFGVALMATYQLHPQLAFMFRMEYSYMPVEIGSTYTRGAHQKFFYRDSSSKAGASHWFVEARLGWRFNILH